MTDGQFRLWQLISPALPIGAYAYSQALEYAVEARWVRGEDEVQQWLEGQMGSVLASLDIPVFARLYRAWRQSDRGAARYWSRLLLAGRESSELLAEERDLGYALARLLAELGVPGARAWCEEGDASYAAMFALGAAHWDVSMQEAAEAYVWAWCERQITAAVKLIPLGQTAGQRLLLRLSQSIPQAADVGLSLKDEQIGALAPGLAIASALHEMQYTRLFRS